MDPITKLTIVRLTGEDGYEIRDQNDEYLDDAGTLEEAVKQACWLADCHELKTVHFLVSSIHENL